MKTRLPLSLFILSLALLTCDDNNDDAFPDLKKYLVRFQEEAKNRGYDLDLSKVQAEMLTKSISKESHIAVGDIQIMTAMV